jgi:hypothetical protein
MKHILPTHISLRYPPALSQGPRAPRWWLHTLFPLFVVVLSLYLYVAAASTPESASQSPTKFLYELDTESEPESESSTRQCEIMVFSTLFSPIALIYSIFSGNIHWVRRPRPGETRVQQKLGIGLNTDLWYVRPRCTPYLALSHS